MLINLTNHPSSQWGESQLNTAMQYGEIIDHPFPMVPPEASEEDISNIAKDVYISITQLYGNNISAIHIMGEFTLCYALIQMFKAAGVICIASTTQRIVTEHPDGTKTSTFRFVKFREYK